MGSALPVLRSREIGFTEIGIRTHVGFLEGRVVTFAPSFQKSAKNCCRTLGLTIPGRRCPNLDCS